jgi:hypothetical protein
MDKSQDAKTTNKIPKTKKPGTERITTRNRTHPKGSKTEKGKGDTRENNCDAPLIE